MKNQDRLTVQRELLRLARTRFDLADKNGDIEWNRVEKLMGQFDIIIETFDLYESVNE